MVQYHLYVFTLEETISFIHLRSRTVKVQHSNHDYFINKIKSHKKLFYLITVSLLLIHCLGLTYAFSSGASVFGTISLIAVYTGLGSKKTRICHCFTFSFYLP